MKPTDCPTCDMLSFRNGSCSHCGFEDREWRPTPKHQVELGLQQIAELKEQLRARKPTEGETDE